jgi:hypothetical protein
MAGLAGGGIRRLVNGAALSTVLEIRTEPERLCKTKWQEYAIRFLFGGIVASVVGVLAQVWGRVVAGLFLAFPAILPASLTLIESHEGKRPAGMDAFGAAMGSIGLMAFVGIVDSTASGSMQSGI